MQIAKWIIQQILQRDVRHIFLVPGAEIDPIIAELGAQTALQTIVACHEEGAGFMADGYARVRNALGVCMGIGSPGAANFIPAMLAAESDHTRMLVITGSSATTLSGQGVFQDASIDGSKDALLAMPITCYSEETLLVEEIPRNFLNALNAIDANQGGVAHLSIPVDLQKASISNKRVFNKEYLPCNQRLLDIERVKSLIQDHLAKKTRVALLLGNGVYTSDARESLETFINKYQIPFAVTFNAKGILPDEHPLCLGMFGYAGNRRAIETLLSKELEVLIILGSDLEARDTLYWARELKENTTLIQIDGDAKNLNRNYPVDEIIHSDCRAVLEFLNSSPISRLTKSIKARKLWLKQIAKIPYFYAFAASSSHLIHPAKLMREVNQLMPENTYCFIDSGAHRAFAGHYWLCGKNGKVFSATTTGPMGWAIPAAVGGKIAAPNHPVIAITSDGCMRMHGMEIATAARYQIPVIFLVSNNSALGNVYLREKKINAGAVEMSCLPYVDWSEFAKCLGADGITIHALEELPKAIKIASASAKPFVINAITDRDVATPIGPYSQQVARNKKMLSSRTTK